MGPRRRALGAILAMATVAGVVLATGTPSGASPGLAAQDLNQPGVTPQALVSTIVGSGVTTSNVTFTGSNCGGGTFSGGTGIIGFDSGIVLGSGSVQSGDGACDGQKGVEGPNSADNNTGDNSQPGDADLSVLAGQTANPPQASAPTNDAAVLQFDFVPNTSQLTFSYVFSSDEYNEFVHSQFNDVFGFFVNGQNCALVPGTTQPVTINSVNGGNPFGTDADNPQLYRNNDPNDPGPAGIDTEMDGLTTVFTCQANVNQGVTNHIKLAIADTSDSQFDSNVFIEAGSFMATTSTSSTSTSSTSSTSTSSTSTTATSSTTSTSSTTTTVLNTVLTKGPVAVAVVARPTFVG